MSQVVAVRGSSKERELSSCCRRDALDGMPLDLDGVG